MAFFGWQWLLWFSACCAPGLIEPFIRGGGGSGNSVSESSGVGATPEPTMRHPAIVVVGPTGSGKSSMALFLAERLGGEVISCDSVAVYRGLDVGSAKPSLADRARIAHHGLDLLDPDQPTTAGDYARAARQAIDEIARRGRLPILAGGTGLYLRATLDGLAPSPPRNEALRERLRSFARRRGMSSLHRLLHRMDPRAAAQIHPNDLPKLIRSLEVSFQGGQPQTLQWQAGKDPLQGFRVLQFGLNPPRAALYRRINQRAADMFQQGLLEETDALRRAFGADARALGSLGYVQALGVLRGSLSLPQAIAETQQGHRNYAKRQMTWFHKDPRLHWVDGFGDEPWVQEAVLEKVLAHQMTGTTDREEQHR